jgi:hypothetical protein
VEKLPPEGHEKFPEWGDFGFACLFLGTESFVRRAS